MNAQNCFTYLIEKTKKLAILNDTQKNIILKDLDYFLRQSKANKKDPHKVLENKWKEFERKTLRTSLLSESKGFFQAIDQFLGRIEIKAFEDPHISRLDQMDMPEFIEDMIREVEKRDSFFTADEELVTYCGLKFLLSEARLPNMKRDRKSIQKVFQKIRPFMEKAGVFYKYNGAKGLSSRLRLFLTGSL